VQLSGALAATLSVMAGLLVGLSSPAAASTIHVNNEVDFRNAWDSNANDTIVLDADIHLTCPGGRAVRDAGVDNPITVDGQGQFKIVQTCSGNGVLGVESNSNVTLRGVTLTGATDAGEGGGIRFRGSGSAQWMIDHTIFDSNSSTVAGTDQLDGGAIYIDSGTGGTLTVTDSTFRNNHANDDGGAIDCNQDSGTVTMNVARSTFTGNTTGVTGHTTGEGGAIDLESADCSLTMVNSTVTGNTSQDLAAVSAENSNDQITLVYTDVVNNIFNPNFSAAAAQGASASKDGGATSSDEVHASTVASEPLANSPANVFLQSPSNLTIFGSVITGPAGGPNCSGDTGVPMTGIISHGFNFADDTSCGLSASTDKQGSGNNPLLGPLADNGGPTQTLLPETGSPLIDGVVAGSCQADGAAGVTTDQRKLARPDTASPACEIGSVEIQPAVVPAPVVITPRFTG
jgi:predicted outer membrane repeat protein